jgi:hypothetical protein
MKNLILFLVLILIAPAIAYAFSPAFGDDPQFRIEITGSDKAGICRVTVHVWLARKDSRWDSLVDLHGD